ncbi:MAG: NADH:flavin oxidoreductase, partial [Victivallaceae bacterium]
MSSEYRKISSDKTAADFAAHIAALGIILGFAEKTRIGESSPLGRPLEYKGRSIGNRWCILPMEGWDCLDNGAPSELTERRWLRFGQ